MIRLAPIIAFSFVLTACAHPEYKIVRAFYSNHDTAEAQDVKLQAAAYEQLKGLSQPTALSFLEADGLTCAGITCRYSSEHKMSTAEVVFGISNPRNRVFSDRRVSNQYFEITLNSDLIQTPDDITADARFESGWTPWHRSPRPSDIEVTHD